MAEYKITVLPAFDSTVTLQKGDHLLLKRDPNNPHDDKAVAVYQGDTKVGYVAASAGTVLPGCKPAAALFKQMGNKKLAEAWVTLNEETTVPTSTGGQMNAFEGECSFIPVMKDQDKKKEAIKVIVGGSLISNPCKTDNIFTLTEKLEKKETLPTYVIKMRKLQNKNESQLAVFCNTKDVPQTDSVGVVLNPVDELRNHITKTGSVTFTAKGVCDKKGNPIQNPDNADVTLCFWGEFYPDETMTDALVEKMKDVVRDGRDKFSSVQEKVSYMTSEGVPEEVILEVLKNIHKPDPKWEHLVPHPKAMFRQSGAYGELTRSLAYRCYGMSLRLVGNKGSGKNTLAETIDWILGRPQYRMEGNAEMDKMDLLGSPQLEDSSTKFEVSDMIRCLEVGGDVVLDEGNTIRPEVASLLHSLTDESRQIQIPGYGLVIRHPLSCITLTMNEGYMGTTKMNEATVDRFVPIQMSQPASIQNILLEAVPKANKQDVKIADKIYLELKNKINNSSGQGTLEPDCMTIRGFIDALRVTPILGLKLALMDCVADKPQDEYSRTEIREIIVAHCR